MRRRLRRLRFAAQPASSLRAARPRSRCSSIRRLNPVDIDTEITIAQDVLGQIERKAISIVKLEGNFAGQDAFARAAQPFQFLIDQFKPAIERLTEASFFLGDDLADFGGVADQFRISGLPIAAMTASATPARNGCSIPSCRPCRAERRINRRRTYSRSVLPGQDAVGDQQADRSRMIGDRTIRNVVLGVVTVFVADCRHSSPPAGSRAMIVWNMSIS